MIYIGNFVVVHLIHKSSCIRNTIMEWLKFTRKAPGKPVGGSYRFLPRKFLGKSLPAWCLEKKTPISPSPIRIYQWLLWLVRLGTTVKKTVLVAWMEGEEVKYKSLRRGQISHDLWFNIFAYICTQINSSNSKRKTIWETDKCNKQTYATKADKRQHNWTRAIQ